MTTSMRTQRKGRSTRKRETLMAFLYCSFAFLLGVLSGFPRFFSVVFGFYAFLLRVFSGFPGFFSVGFSVFDGVFIHWVLLYDVFVFRYFTFVFGVFRQYAFVSGPRV